MLAQRFRQRNPDLGRSVSFFSRWFASPRAKRQQIRRLSGCETLETRCLLAAEAAFVWSDAAEAEATIAAPDFSLVDVNPNSSRHGEQVSPRDYLQQVSAYYFGYGL